MGLNISVMKPDHSGDHPDWDWLRYAGDREFGKMVFDLPHITKGPNGYGDDWQYIRPADFTAWREAIAKVEWPNPGRFEGLLDILEREPDYWIYLSY